MWESERHEIYIGISNASVVTRLRQHVANHPDANIQAFRFRAEAGDRGKLREIERDLIYSAIDEGFTVFNREHSAIIYGDSDFDEVISVDQQKQWFLDPLGPNLTDLEALPRELSDSEIVRGRKHFEKLVGLPSGPKVTEAVSLYLAACTPFPRVTERAYWTLTSLPSWSSRRLATLNMAYLEMLFFHQDPGRKNIEVYMSTDYQYLPRRLEWLNLRRLGVKKLGQLHRSGGPNEEVLRFKSIESFVEIMTLSPEVRSAAARFALDRMRRSRVSGRFQDAHNALLAEKALDRARHWKPSDFQASSDARTNRSRARRRRTL